ncbi:hypothetical protein TcCL_ESM02003, partial [Trypanosoma cruzi]
DREDPSTRAQCLHGIESALAALGVEESEEPAAAAIMRAAEEARAREEELHDRLDESAARGRALESKLSELTRVADSLQRALDGSVLAVEDEEDASAAGDRAVEALKRLCEDSVTVSAVMGGAMQRKLEDAEAEPLLQQCRKMASDMEALRRSERCSVVNLFNQRALFLGSLLVSEELDDRISLLSELSFFPSNLLKILVSYFTSVSGICALLRCDAGSIVHQVEKLLESRDYYCRLVGGGDFILETDDDDVTRAECVHVIRRAVSRLAPAILDDATLRLPEKLQGAVQGIIRDISHIRASLEEALDSAGRAEKDLETIVSASERALLMLRGVDSSSEAVDGVVVARPSVSFLSRSLLSQAGEITGRLRDLSDVCVECNAIVGQALKRECEQLQVGAEGSLSSTAPIEPDFLFLVDHCRELVAEVFTLREQRRSSLAAIERNVGDHEVLLGAVRGSVNALLFALDNAASVASQGEEDGDSSESVANLCDRLGSCTRAVTRLLREKEHAASASVKLLQEALLPEEDRRSSDNDGLFSLASDVVRALEARRVELDSMGKALEQSRHFAKEYRRRMEKNFAEQDAAMTAQVQTHEAMEGQLKEATERQVQATANAAKLLRDLSEFAGSVAAITLYDGDVKVDDGERSEDARVAHKKDVVTYEVSRERLEGILENCSTVMRTLEAAKAKAKSLSSEAEDLRGRLRESENTSRELEYQSRHAETKAAARVAAMTEEMNFLRNALQAKVTECERIQQQVQDTERRVDRLQAEMADNTKTFGNERDTLSKVHSLLLLENEEMRRQLEELRTEQKELQNFLRGCQVTSLDDAAKKMVAFAGDVLLNSLALEEAENRVQLLQNWALSYGVHTAPLLGICARVANAISASEFEDIPMRVAEMLKREQEFGRLLGVPARTVGPTRAALLKMVTDWAEKIGVEQQPDAGTFLTELDFALSDLHSGYASLKNKIAAIQNELYQSLSTLETGGKQAEQITALLRSAHPTEELTVTTATAGEMSPSAILQVALASLRLEVEWAVEKIVSNTEQTRRTLEVLEPVCSGRSVLEVCLHAAEELQERRSTEEVLRAELANVQAKAESYRGCIEASMRCLPDSLIHVKAGDDLQRRCASASAELRRRMEVLSSAQRIIALAGHDNRSGDLCMNVEDMLRKLRQLKEREKMLEANYESVQQRALKLEKTLRATEERLEETITFQAEKERNAIMQEKEKQNLLQAQLSESIHEREKLRTTLAACASAVGCSPEGGSGGNDAANNHNNKNGDDKEVADVLRAIRALASAHDASVNELEELREQHALSRKALASANDIRALAQEEQCRLMEEVERLRAEIIAVTASNEEHRAALLHLTEQAEGVVLRLSTAHSPSLFWASSTLTKRAPLVAQCLLDACNVFEENRCALEDELSTLKRLHEESQHEMKAVNEVLCEALELTGETNPSDTTQLGAIVKEKLSKALKEKNAIAVVTGALQSENATLKASCTSTEAKLEETTTALEQVDTQKRALQEELRAFAAFAENVAETVGEPLPSGSTDLERLKVAFAAKQASLQHHAEELTRVREELDVATSSSAVMRTTIDENAAERERLIEQLLGAEQEREALLKASEQLVERVQSILDDHVEVQRELTFAEGDDDVTVVDIVQACVEQLDKNRIGVETSNEQLAALQRENAMLMKEIQRLQNSAAVKSGEVTELHEQLRILLESRQVAQADQSKLQAEHDSLSRQVQALFTDALRMAADEMGLQLPMFTDTTASGALQGLRSLFDYIAEKFRSGALRSDDTEDKIESLKQLLQLQERQNAKENKILYRTFCDHVVVYTGTNYSRREDGDEDSSNGKPHRLTTDFLVAVGETLHSVHTEFRHAGRLFRRLIGGPAELSSSLRGMTLPESAAWLGEAANETVERSELLHNAIRAVSQIVEILPIDLASSQEQVTEWVESFSLWLERAQRGIDSFDRLLEALTSVVHSHGGTVEETLSTNTTITSFNNYNNNSSSNHHHHLDIVDTSLQDLNNSRTDISFSRYITDPHHRAVFNAVRDLFSQLEGRGRVLTSEWQALMDQNNRLIHERRQTEEEQARVEDHVQELRRVVQRKIEEDRRVEQSLKELDRHLDMQARELAMKYRSDHDIIVRQFTELRGTIRRTIKPPRSHSTAATTFGSASHRTL